MDSETKSRAVEDLARSYYGDDNSHGWNHIQDVLTRARRLKGLDLSPDERAAVLFHDSSLSTGPRETHEIDSSAIARRELDGLFRKRVIDRIAKAIARHRASYKGRRYTFLDNLLSSADRDDPDADFMLRRSYQYAREHGMSHDESIDNAFNHIPDKYGRNGYAFKTAPKLYLDKNRDNLEKFWHRLETLKRDQVKRLVEESKA